VFNLYAALESISRATPDVPRISTNGEPPSDSPLHVNDPAKPDRFFPDGKAKAMK